MRDADEVREGTLRRRAPRDKVGECWRGRRESAGFRRESLDSEREPDDSRRERSGNRREAMIVRRREGGTVAEFRRRTRERGSHVREWHGSRREDGGG